MRHRFAPRFERSYAAAAATVRLAFDKQLKLLLTFDVAEEDTLRTIGDASADESMVRRHQRRVQALGGPGSDGLALGELAHVQPRRCAAHDRVTVC